MDEEENNKPFHCEVCAGNYSTKDSLRSHKRIAHGILANGRRRTDPVVVNNSIESEDEEAGEGGDLSGSTPETSDNELSPSENKVISGRYYTQRAKTWKKVHFGRPQRLKSTFF